MNELITALRTGLVELADPAAAPQMQAYMKSAMPFKAIGWALREYAKTDPAWVQHFVDARDTTLSPLSIREATRHIRKKRN